MSQGFIKIGAPQNGRQTYYINDAPTHKRYYYSLPVQDADRFEKYDRELVARANALQNIDTKQVTKNLEEKHAYTKARIASFAAGLIGGGIPMAACLKFIKGNKRYIIGGLSALIVGGLSSMAAYIGSLGMMIQKEALNTKQGQDLKNILMTKTNFDMKLEKVENLN